MRASLKSRLTANSSPNHIFGACVETEIPKKYNWPHGLAKGVTA
jgi:hypothetical protein